MAEAIYSAQQKLEAVERELGFRRRVYERRVSEGKMSRQKADYEIGVFESIAADYREKAAGERLL